MKLTLPYAQLKNPAYELVKAAVNAPKVKDEHGKMVAPPLPGWRDCLEQAETKILSSAAPDEKAAEIAKLEAEVSQLQHQS